MSSPESDPTLQGNKVFVIRRQQVVMPNHPAITNNLFKTF